MLLRDLEQHAAEVVGDERRDGRQQRAERVDEALGPHVVGEVARPQRAPHVLVEHLDRALGDLACSVVLTAREREELGEREAGLEQSQPARSTSASAAVYPATPSRCCGTSSPSRATASSSGAGTPTRSASSSRSSRSASPVLRAGDRGGERHVGGVELAVEQPADHREREALALEV